LSVEVDSHDTTIRIDRGEVARCDARAAAEVENIALWDVDIVPPLQTICSGRVEDRELKRLCRVKGLENQPVSSLNHAWRIGFSKKKLPTL
jgi:hypothetical protein